MCRCFIMTENNAQFELTIPLFSFSWPILRYFAAWLGLIGSLLWAAPLFPPHSDAKKGPEESDKDKTLAMIALSSVVLIISIISIGDWGNLTTANVIYGLLAAALSLFLALVLGFAKNLNVH